MNVQTEITNPRGAVNAKKSGHPSRGDKNLRGG